MKIDIWEELTDKEKLLLDKAEIISENNSLHVTEIRRKLGDQIFRSLYVISDGSLITHEKLIETLNI